MIDHISEQYHSDTWGDYEIIEKLEKIEGSNKYKYRVRFLDTGTIKDASYENIKAGKVKDENRRLFLNKDIVFTNRCGEKYKIIADHGCIDGHNVLVDVQFEDGLIIQNSMCEERID